MLRLTQAISETLVYPTQVITPSTSLQHISNCSAVTAAPSSSASTLPSNRHRDAAPAANVTSRSRSRSAYRTNCAIYPIQLKKGNIFALYVIRYFQLQHFVFVHSLSPQFRLPHSHPPLLSPNDSSASSSLGGQLHGDKIEVRSRISTVQTSCRARANSVSNVA